MRLLVANNTSPHFLAGSKYKMPGLSESQVQNHITQLLVSDVHVGTRRHNSLLRVNEYLFGLSGHFTSHRSLCAKG